MPQSPRSQGREMQKREDVRQAMTIEKSRTKDEAAIRELIDGFVEALRTKDIHRVMSVFAPQAVSFDLGPPLQHGGDEEFMRRWHELFESYHGEIDYDVRDLSI